MNLTEPASVALSPATAAIYRVLAQADSPFTIRQLARVAGVSPNMAQSVVAKGAETGVVLTQPAGRSILCQFNNEHLAASAIRDLVTLRARMLAWLVEEFGRWEEPPLHASLFGSAARGDGGTQSDLDILIVHGQPRSDADVEKWHQQLFATGTRTQRATGNPVNWLDVSLIELQDMRARQEPILAELRRDSVRLVGDQFNVLLVEQS